MATSDSDAKRTRSTPPGLTSETDHARPSASTSQYWTQDSPGIRGKAEKDDTFGWALAAGNFRDDVGSGERSAKVDLAIGVPGEDGTQDVALPARGAVNVLCGADSGLTAAQTQYWTQETPGIKGKRQFGDVFGSALSARAH